MLCSHIAFTSWDSNRIIQRDPVNTDCEMMIQFVLVELSLRLLIEASKRETKASGGLFKL